MPSKYSYSMADSSSKKEEEGEVINKTKDGCDIIYKIDDNPPWYYAIALAFQVKKNYACYFNRKTLL